LGFFERKKKMVACAYNYCAFVIGIFDILFARQRCCPVYLYIILGYRKVYSCGVQIKITHCENRPPGGGQAVSYGEGIFLTGE